nr:hypothetical protein MACL_00001036 [Theileria orientalis]
MATEATWVMCGYILYRKFSILSLFHCYNCCFAPAGKARVTMLRT